MQKQPLIPDKKGHWESYGFIDGLPDVNVNAIVEDSTGSLWFGTSDGVSRYDGERFVTFTPRDGLVNHQVTTILEDKVGDLWFGTKNGLTRYDGETFVSLTEAEGLACLVVNAILEDKAGYLWFGTAAGVSRYDGSRFVNFTAEDGFVESRVTAIAEGRDGSLWFGTSVGVARYDGVRFVTFTVEDRFLETDITAILEDSAGNLWFGTHKGVIRYDGEQFVVFTTEDGLAGNQMSSIIEDSAGSLWFGATSGGVSRYDGTCFVTFTMEDGLVHNWVMSILEDSAGNLWFGTGGGVSRYDRGSLVTFSTEQVKALDKNLDCSDAAEVKLKVIENSIHQRIAALESDLERRNQELEEKNRLLTALNQSGQAVLSSLEVEQVLDALTEQILVAGFFRSLMVALVDEETRSVEVVINLFYHTEDGAMDSVIRRPSQRWVVTRSDVIHTRYDLNDDNITAVVARTGEMQVITEWDDRFDPRFTRREDRTGKVSYFIPVKHGAQTVAVLATESGLDEKAEVLRRIEALKPLLSYVAIALKHARLYKSVRESKKALEAQTSELARSNAELEQFAYVASHDLQEPLRMVSSYLQLLERRYGDKLDSAATQFINYAVDGANRMKALINDLLAYSRVSTRGRDFKPTDSNVIFGRVLTNLQVVIRESQAVVTRDRLPQVMADATQLTMLFQNLIGNAIKFRREIPPEIHIGVEQKQNQWCFSVRDNGIGIDPQYAERIFVIFQRLHTREEYSGTGIGLAICKRIVERHGGQIWVESEYGCGTTFYFTLPE